MKQLIMRLLSRLTHSSHYTLFRSSHSRVPEGHVPVYVGEEMARFVVSFKILNHPIFVKLLNQSAEEYGYDQKGVLRLPCPVIVFERVLDALRRGCDTEEIQELLNDSSEEVLL